jgi:hypothetical protein
VASTHPAGHGDGDQRRHQQLARWGGYGSGNAPAARSRGGGAAKAAAGVTAMADRTDVVGADWHSCSLRVWSGADTERDERGGWWGGEWRACVVEAARERGGRACGLGWGRWRGGSDGVRRRRFLFCGLACVGGGRRRGSERATRGRFTRAVKRTTKFLSPLHSF